MTLVALAVAGLAAACGGSGAGTPSPSTASSDPAAQTRSECDASGASSLRAANCAARGIPSLDLTFSKSFVAPKAGQSDCETTANVVFYAADDWMRLAQKLAADGYPCADYFISIPPTTGGDSTYTVPTPGQVARLRRLGSRFHAMAEIRVAAWQEWLQANPGKTWFDAGVEARRRMAEAGYDPSQGDTWAVNEFPLEILADGQIQANMRQLVRGLARGDGGPPVQGLVYAVTPEQATSDVGSYAEQLKHFLGNDPFWQEMSHSVRFWAQEVYANAKSCCVGGATAAQRSARLNEYLQHPLVLADTLTGSASPARSFLHRAYTPIGNAAWAWTSAFGFTAIPAEQMGRFVAAQIAAIRSFQETRGAGAGGFGFAWAPLRPNGVGDTAFVHESGEILTRMASSINASLREGDASAACGPGGAWCACTVSGSAFTNAWAGASS